MFAKGPGAVVLCIHTFTKGSLVRTSRHAALRRGRVFPSALNLVLPTTLAGAVHTYSYPGVPGQGPFALRPPLVGQTPWPPGFCLRRANNSLDRSTSPRCQGDQN